MHETPTRRQVLAGLGAGGTAALAGCSALTGSDSPAGDQLDAPVKGDPEAGVTLAVYEDFLCPACRAYDTQVYPELATEFVDPGRIRYEHRDFPLSVHEPGASQAANAARAVQDEAGDEAFWAYAARLFARQGETRSSGDVPAVCADIANVQGFDAEAVESAAREERYEATVSADRQSAQDLGLPGTPSFVIDGDPVTFEQGDNPVQVLRSTLEERL